VDVTLIDRTNHHLFQPLLYQVATAGLSAPAVAAPVRHILRRQMRSGRLTVLQAEAHRVDVGGHRVLLEDGSALPYEHLIVAAGAINSWFGHDDWARHAPALKTLADALAIRARVIGAFERAERCSDPAERQTWLGSSSAAGLPGSNWPVRWSRSRATPCPASFVISIRARPGSAWSKAPSGCWAPSTPSRRPAPPPSCSGWASSCSPAPA
jgi:hypothetical protein